MTPSGGAITEPQFLVDEASRLMGVPVTLEDRDFRLVAYGPHSGTLDEVRLRSILTREASPEMRHWFEQFGIAEATAPTRIPRDPRRGAMSRLCIPVRWDGDTCGYLWALDDRDALTSLVTEPVMQMAQSVGPLLAHRVRTSPSPINGRRRPHGATNPVVAVAVRSRHRDAPLALDLSRVAHRAATHQSRTDATLVLPLSTRTATDPTPDRVGEEVVALLADASDRPTTVLAEVVVGISDPQLDLGRVDTSAWQANHAVEVAQTVPDQAPVAHWSGIGVMRLGALSPVSELGDAVLSSRIRHLTQHADRTLVRTARAFLDAAGDVAATAERLSVDAATIRCRLVDIAQVTGLDLDRGWHRLELHLALSLEPLLFRGLAEIEGMGHPTPITTW